MMSDDVRIEEFCCDELEREFREGALMVDEQGSINVVEVNSGRVVIYGVRSCLFCGEGIGE